MERKNKKVERYTYYKGINENYNLGSNFEDIRIEGRNYIKVRNKYIPGVFEGIVKKTKSLKLSNKQLQKEYGFSLKSDIGQIDEW